MNLKLIRICWRFAWQGDGGIFNLYGAAFNWNAQGFERYTGSIYFHCNSTASHYLKLILDMIFRHRNFVSDITWKRTTAKSNFKRLANNKDTIFFYHKDANNPNATYNQIYLPLNKNMVKTHYTQKDSEGRVYGLDNLKDPMPGDGYACVWNGVVGTWRCPIKTMREHEKNGRLAYTKNGVARYIRYLDESQGVAIDNAWIDIKPVNSQTKERTGYPTQKPFALLNRIISVSSNPGDVVLDPFCGCATTCVAAQQLRRKWIGIDIEKNAVALLKDRLEGDAGMFKDFIATDKIPVRTDVLFESPDKKSIKERLYKEQNGKCNGCGVAFEIRNLAVDHIVPVHHGGGSYYENYQLLCGHCNSTKGAWGLWNT